MLRFKFPIVIIDEDFRSENASGLSIRALAQVIEKEGFEVLGVTTYSDLSQFAQQQSRASAFIVSIDDEEFIEPHKRQSFAGRVDDPGTPENEAIEALRAFVREIRKRNAENRRCNADIPIFLYGETRTTHHLPNEVLRELHGFIHMFEDTPRVRRNCSRAQLRHLGIRSTWPNARNKLRAKLHRKKARVGGVVWGKP